MELRTLGATGIGVSVLGLGTVKWGRTLGLKYPNPVTLPTDDELKLLIAAARDSGINLIDTAPAYGIAQDRIGAIIGRREDWVISTKVGENFSHGVSEFDFSVRSMRDSLDQSLRSLRTDHVDLLLVHSDGAVEHSMSDELIDALKREKSAGRVRAIGISSKSPKGGFGALSWADVLMVTLNPEYLDEIDLIHEAGKRGVGVLVKKALLSGYGGAQHRPSVRDCLSIALGTAGVTSVVIGSVSPINVQNNARIADEILRGGAPGKAPGHRC